MRGLREYDVEAGTARILTYDEIDDWLRNQKLSEMGKKDALDSYGKRGHYTRQQLEEILGDSSDLAEKLSNRLVPTSMSMNPGFYQVFSNKTRGLVIYFLNKKNDPNFSYVAVNDPNGDVGSDHTDLTSNFSKAADEYGLELKSAPYYGWKGDQEFQDYYPNKTPNTLLCKRDGETACYYVLFSGDREYEAMAFADEFFATVQKKNRVGVPAKALNKVKLLKQVPDPRKSRYGGYSYMTNMGEMFFIADVVIPPTYRNKSETEMDQMDLLDREMRPENKYEQILDRMRDRETRGGWDMRTDYEYTPEEVEANDYMRWRDGYKMANDELGKKWDEEFTQTPERKQYLAREYEKSVRDKRDQSKSADFEVGDEVALLNGEKLGKIVDKSPNYATIESPKGRRFTGGYSEIKKLGESILGDAATFYDFVSNELHDISGVDITSTEPEGGEYSCFDYDQCGCDDADPPNGCYTWRDCDMTMDDDGLYFKSKSGKDGCILIYTIVKVEGKEGTIKLWIAPQDSSDDMGIVNIYATENTGDSPTSFEDDQGDLEEKINDEWTDEDSDWDQTDSEGAKGEYDDDDDDEEEENDDEGSDEELEESVYYKSLRLMENRR